MTSFELPDIIQSLISLMREETERLLATGAVRDLDEIATAKARLVGAIEARTAQLDREQPDWLEQLEPDDREAMYQVMAELRDVSAANAMALERQIELSVEMLEAITTEARRISGTQTERYCLRGGVSRIQNATPISVNTQL